MSSQWPANWSRVASGQDPLSSLLKTSGGWGSYGRNRTSPQQIQESLISREGIIDVKMANPMRRASLVKGIDFHFSVSVESSPLHRGNENGLFWENHGILCFDITTHLWRSRTVLSIPLYSQDFCHSYYLLDSDCHPTCMTRSLGLHCICGSQD